MGTMKSTSKVNLGYPVVNHSHPAGQDMRDADFSQYPVGAPNDLPSRHDLQLLLGREFFRAVGELEDVSDFFPG